MSLLDAPPTPTEEAPPRSERSARASALVAVLAVLAAILTAPSGGGDLAAGEFGRLVAGHLEVARGDGWESIPVGRVVATDETVRTRDERAELAIREGTVSFARSSEAALAGDGLTLERGAVLFESDRTYRVRLGTVSGEGRGTWRVDATGLARFATYRGGVAVSGLGGDAVAVQRLQEAPVLGGVDGAVQPLRYLAGDPWDERLLADALAVDRALDRTSATLAVRYGTALQDRAFYADFTGFEDLVAHLDELAERGASERFGPPAPTLVALVVADLLVRRAGVAPAEAAAVIDGLREAGATWGLIVVLHDLGPADLDASIERGLRQRGEAVESGAAAPVRRPAPPTAEPDPTPTATPPSDDDAPGGEPSEPEPDPDPSEPPPDDPGTLDPVEEEVEDLGALLDPILPGASETAEDLSDTVDTVDDLLPPPPSLLVPPRAGGEDGTDHPG